MADKLACWNCGTENFADSQYCDQCSAPLHKDPRPTNLPASARGPNDTLALHVPGAAIGPSRPVSAPPAVSMPPASSTTAATVSLPAAALAPPSSTSANAGTTPIQVEPADAHPVARDRSLFPIIGAIVLGLAIFLAAGLTMATSLFQAPAAPTPALGASTSQQATEAAMNGQATQLAQHEAALQATFTAISQGGSLAQQGTAIVQATEAALAAAATNTTLAAAGAAQAATGTAAAARDQQATAVANQPPSATPLLATATPLPPIPTAAVVVNQPATQAARQLLSLAATSTALVVNSHVALAAQTAAARATATAVA
ncbi:MAG TPA: hypothetical protein VKY74_03940, partial [Chloroflexia bacterium]|nr:hypothetical protein [Chloroflexia bacterium]